MGGPPEGAGGGRRLIDEEGGGDSGSGWRKRGLDDESVRVRVIGPAGEEDKVALAVALVHRQALLLS